MTPSKTVAPVKAEDAPGTDLSTVDAATQAILDQQDDEFDDDFVTTPILKIGQPLTREVTNEQAEAGEFINTLTGEGIGNKIGFVVSYYQKGRFAADRDSNKAYVAFGNEIPPSWGDLVGEEFVGTQFSEHPDAEETYKKRVNNKEIPWGKGPLISTTHNFTGLAIVSGAGDEPDELQPVRLSLQRTNVPAVKKIITLKKASLRGRPFWDKVFELGTEKKVFDKGSAHLLTVRLGRDTSGDEKAAAVELATAVAAGRVGDNQADAGTDKLSSPDAKGGLGI
jgi:hypothetical protein